MKKKEHSAKIIVISGPSGSGKTTIIEKLLTRKRLKGSLIRVITATTRGPRKGERNGVDYFFMSDKEFSQKRERNYFIETKQFSDNWYGTPKFFIDQARKEHKDVIFCVDVEGALVLKQLFPEESVLVFIYPPSDEILCRRLRQRNTEDDSVVKKRLRIAKSEVKYAHCYDYGVINDDLREAVAQVESVIIAERVRI